MKNHAEKGFLMICDRIWKICNNFNVNEIIHEQIIHIHVLHSAV